MKLKNFLKYFNEGLSVEIYDCNEGNIYSGEICNIPQKLLECKQLDTNDNIDIITEMGCYTVLEIYVK